MDNSNLFSHPDPPQQDTSREASTKGREASTKGVEYPTFSDRPDTPKGKHS